MVGVWWVCGGCVEGGLGREMLLFMTMLTTSEFLLEHQQGRAPLYTFFVVVTCIG